MHEKTRQNEISFRGKITEKIFLRVQNLMSGWIRFLLMALFPIIAAYSALQADYQPADYRIMVVVMGILAAPVMWWGQRYGILRTYRKSPYLKQELSGTISADGLEMADASGQNSLPWSAFIRVRESNDTILLFQGPRLARILVREFFADDEQWQHATELIRTGFAASRG